MSDWSLFSTVPCSVDISKMNKAFEFPSWIALPQSFQYNRRYQPFFTCPQSYAFMNGWSEEDSTLAPPLLPEIVTRTKNVPENLGQEWRAIFCATSGREFDTSTFFHKVLQVDFFSSNHSSFICLGSQGPPYIPWQSLEYRVSPCSTSEALWVQTHCSHDHLLSETAWSFSLPLTKWARFLFSIKILLSSCMILPWKTHCKDVVRRDANTWG